MLSRYEASVWYDVGCPTSFLHGALRPAVCIPSFHVSSPHGKVRFCKESWILFPIVTRSTKMQTHNHGYPRMGSNREPQKGCELAEMDSGAVTHAMGQARLRHSNSHAGVSVSTPDPLPLSLVGDPGSCPACPVPKPRAQTNSDTEVELRWQVPVAWEICSQTLERSRDGQVFHDLKVAEANAGMDTAHAGRYLDREPLAGLAYYRLQAVDCHGSTHHSATAPRYLQGLALPLRPPATPILCKMRSR